MRTTIKDYIVAFIGLALGAIVFIGCSVLYLSDITAAPEVILNIRIGTAVFTFLLGWWYGFMFLDMTAEHPRFWAPVYAAIVAAAAVYVPQILL